MTREIKFRMWTKMEREDGSHHMAMLDHDCLLEWTLKDLTDGEDVLMQYTGLKDKNGKEIYFGDIVRAVGKSVGENDPQYDAIRGVGKQPLFCECDPSYLRIRFTQKQNGLFEFLPHELDDIEVLGNIYENPELITQA